MFLTLYSGIFARPRRQHTWAVSGSVILSVQFSTSSIGTLYTGITGCVSNLVSRYVVQIGRPRFGSSIVEQDGLVIPLLWMARQPQRRFHATPPILGSRPQALRSLYSDITRSFSQLVLRNVRFWEKLHIQGDNAYAWYLVRLCFWFSCPRTQW